MKGFHQGDWSHNYEVLVTEGRQVRRMNSGKVFEAGSVGQIKHGREYMMHKSGQRSKE